MRLLVYDFEVFKKLWMLVVIDYDTKERFVIINDADKLQEFYDEHKDDVFIGYNSRGYDQYIFKGILMGKDPWKINNGIIVEGKKGYQVLQKAWKIPLNNFDIQTGFHSLKQLEGFMGSMIKESSVDFKITRDLTIEEVDETLLYCIHDVEQTIEVFKNLRHEFDSQLLLIEAFDLEMDKFTKTKAQLSAFTLGAKKEIEWSDEFELSFPDTLVLSDKYNYVYKWYLDELNRDYKKKLKTNISNVPHVFAWGGIHGAIPNYIGEGDYIMSDIASMYPALMIEYDYSSRNIKNPEKYREIRDRRIVLKKEKNPMQLPLKIVLNSTYGAMKDKYNELYDPLMANNVCVGGQLLLLDLIEKVEPFGELIQSNTDGILVKVHDREGYLKACDEWCTRTRLDLEHDDYKKVIQKDVNNYIIVEPSGKYKSKGAYVKKLSPIDYDLPIVNKALIDYFTQDIPIADTINNCTDLIEFQQIVKISRIYKYALHGNTPISERVIRVFASTDEADEGIFKLKEGNELWTPQYGRCDKTGETIIINEDDDKREKVPKTPEKAFIFNENVIGVKTPEKLNKQHYIDMALGRLDDFVNGKIKVEQSNIKGINKVIHDSILEVIDNSNDIDFFDVLIELYKIPKITKSHITKMIQTDHFIKFGNSKFLYEYYSLFLLFWKTKDKEIRTEITSSKVDKNKLPQSVFNTYGVREKSKYVNLSVRNILCELTFPSNNYSYVDKVRYQLELTKDFNYHTNELEHRYIVLVNELIESTRPQVVCTSIGSGKRAKLRVANNQFGKLQIGDIIKLDKLSKTPKEVYNGTRMVLSRDKFDIQIDRLSHPKEWKVKEINNDK